ncbi:protein kinase 4-like [Diaphorina citri]|uniref:Protein kinase 4-like n=1 Tax=Diaphorina citri TaxID=121845 RepID=A0A3Q0JBR7_DIACI|nr:protein kinase 4-like [Diaphorina citri]
MSRRGKKQTSKALVNTRSNSILNKDKNIGDSSYENMNIEELKDEIEKISLQYNDNTIQMICNRLCQLYSTNITDQENKIEELLSDQKALQDKLRECETRIETLIAEYDEQVEEYSNKVTEATNNSRKFKRQVSEFQELEKHMKQDIAKLKQERDGLKITIDALKGTVEKLKNTCYTRKYEYKIHYDSDPENSCNDFDLTESINEPEKSLAYELENTIKDYSLNGSYNKRNKHSDDIEETSSDSDESCDELNNTTKMNSNFNASNTEETTTKESQKVVSLELSRNEQNTNVVNKKSNELGNEPDELLDETFSDETKEQNVNNTNEEKNNKRTAKNTNNVQNSKNKTSANAILDTSNHNLNNSMHKEKTCNKKRERKQNMKHLSPDIEIYVPEHTTVSPVVRRYINYNEEMEKMHSQNQDFSVAVKLIDLEEEIRINSKRISKIEERIKEKDNVSSNENDIHEIKNDKKRCVMIGDSHLRYVQQIMERNQSFMENYSVTIDMKPGLGFENICKDIPNNMKEDSLLVVCAGTNDLYKTEFSTVEREITKLSKIKQKVILISIPPQFCEYTNIDIIKLNTRIKYLCKSYQNIEILNTHSFIKPQHLARDGVHLSKRAKIWMATKLMSMITAEKYTPNETNKNKKQLYHTTYTDDEKNSYLRKSGNWKNGKLFSYIPYHTERSQACNNHSQQGTWLNGNYIPHPNEIEYYGSQMAYIGNCIPYANIPNADRSQNSTYDLEWPKIQRPIQRQSFWSQMKSKEYQSNKQVFHTHPKATTHLIWNNI